MRAHYGKPSGTYTLTLTRAELEQLLEGECIGIHTSMIPTRTSTMKSDAITHEISVYDKRAVCTSGLTMLESIAIGDKEVSNYIQFLHIRMEE